MFTFDCFDWFAPFLILLVRGDIFRAKRHFANGDCAIDTWEQWEQKSNVASSEKCRLVENRLYFSLMLNKDLYSPKKTMVIKSVYLF